MILGLLLSVAFAEAVHFDQATVAKSRAEAKPLYAVSGARVIMAHKDAPGEVEVHLYETDIMLLQEGEAEMVVGGKTEGMKEVSDGELRGTSIADGKTYLLKKGEVMVIPAKEPHWFKKIIKPIDYMVVKQKEKRRGPVSRAFYSN